MEIIEFVAEIKWPIAAVVLGLIFKKPLSELITKTKNFEYRKNSDGHEVTASFVSAGLVDAKQNLKITNNAGEPSQEELPDPKLSIIEAYKNLEIAAEQKLKELNISLSETNFKGRALSYLSYKGAFSPKIESAIQDIQFLRNQVVHSSAENIDKEDAIDYLSVIHKIEKIVNALDRLPAMHLNAITMILRNISVILDSNKYTEISIDEIHEHIENGTILDFISGFDEARELKGIIESDLWEGFDKFYVQSLQSIYYGYAGNERRKWGIQNSGICLLLAWTNEIIQMGSGWHPNTDLSELDEE